MEQRIIKRLSQSEIEVYYKVRQVLRTSGITRYDRLLLQNPLGITKCGGYYEVRRSSSAW